MDFEIRRGILDKQIDQLIEYSLNDESVGKFTSDRERFKNRQAFEEWQQKGREIFTLNNSNNDLVGIVWTGLKEKQTGNKKYNKTLAIRIYGEARGKGLGLNFMKSCIKGKGYWLETSNDNLAAKALYSKFGFKQVSDVDENGKIIMTY